MRLTCLDNFIADVIPHFPRKLSELGSRLDFGIQGLGTASGLPSAHEAHKVAFRSILSEIRPGGAGPIPELRRHGLSEGPNGVSRCHLERLGGRIFTPLIYNRYFYRICSPLSAIIALCHWILFDLCGFDLIRIHMMWFAMIRTDSIPCGLIRCDLIWFDFDLVWFDRSDSTRCD